MLLTLPMVPALKRAFPACRVTVLASAANAAAARHHPGVDHVEVDPLEAKGSRLRGVWSLAAQIRRVECDAAVVVHPTPRLALAVYLAGVPMRIGSAYRAYSFLFNRRVREHRSRLPWKHETVYNLNLLQPLGVTPTNMPSLQWTVDCFGNRASTSSARAVGISISKENSAHPEPVEGCGSRLSTLLQWQVGADEAAQADRLLRDVGLGTERFIVIHPGNAGSALNWSPAQYGELGRRLAAAGVRVVITGSEAEVALTAHVSASAGPGTVDLGGKLTLVQLAALLKRCALYVGSSTGPTHLAAAVGAPVVALYSPLRSNAPDRWAPIGERVTVLQPAVDLVCPRCLGPRCPYYHCMERHLGVDDVERAARQVLGLASASGAA
jgi:ADP-heptose:LPS heptosyltransferase